MHTSHQHYHPSSHQIGIITSLCLSLLVLSSTVSALPPAPASSVAYITIDENTLYIQGGIDPFDTNKTSSALKSKQFFSLDLTRLTTWNTTSTTLPWTQLNADGDSGPAAYGHFLSVAPKRRNISVWDPSGTNSSIMSYSLDANKWTKIGDRPKELTTQPGLQAVSHPTSGLVYIPSGRSNAGGDMLIYDLSARITTWAPMPPRGSSNALQWYGHYGDFMDIYLHV
ncbi:hypothetical protein BGX30_001443 [Mortierella sp. GBA39]|nr:hypothetical protein BGX30_001443 [Mortierella sp. GBA39]